MESVNQLREQMTQSLLTGKPAYYPYATEAEFNRQQYINIFNELMKIVLAGGQPDQVLDPSIFDPRKNAYARLIPSNQASRLMFPVIMFNGREITVPVGATFLGSGFNDFVDAIIRNSAYSQLADAMLLSIQNQRRSLRQNMINPMSFQ